MAKPNKQYGLMAGVMAGNIKNSPKGVVKNVVEETPTKKRSAFSKHLRNSKRKVKK